MTNARQARPFHPASIVSALLLAAAISGASLASQSTKSAPGHSFIGTTPAATAIEELPATF